MICVIMQPTYLPWMGYFSLIYHADKFVFLDDVKLEKCSWQVRNRIKSKEGYLYLSQSVATPKGRMLAKIDDVYFSNIFWKKKHLKSIAMNYGKSPFFKEVFPFIEECLSFDRSNKLSDFNINLIKELAIKLKIKTKFYLTSEMLNIDAVKDERLAEICQHLNCDTYLSPQGAAAYIDAKSEGGALIKSNIQLIYQKFDHPTYPQQFNGFLSHLSIIDALLNIGFEKTSQLIKNSDKSFKVPAVKAKV